MTETKTQKTVSTEFIPDLEHIKENQSTLPTWALLGVLILAFIILKTFIYIPDEKRKGQ